MTMKTLILVLSNVVLIHSNTPKCCNGNNLALSTRKCSNGEPLHVGHCNNTYLIETDDNSTITLVDPKNNLVIDSDYEEAIPEHDFCLTTLQKDHREVYIVCYDVTDSDIPNVTMTVNTVFQLISVFFIIVTVAVYLTIPSLLDLQGINIIHSISGLAFAFIILSALNFSGGEINNPVVCHMLAYFLYASFMYAFFWLNIISFHIWRQVVNPKIFAKFKSWKLVYYCYGLGGPIFLLIFLLSVHHSDSPHLKHIHPGIGQVSCWFKTTRETSIYLYGPIAVLLAFNVVFFAWTALVLWRQAVDPPNSSRVLKYRVRLYVKLFFVMGLSWIFEVVQGLMVSKERWYWVIIDLINSLEGVIIFLILVVFRKKVIRHLANRQSFAKFNFPTKWQQVHDSECEELEQEGVNLGAENLHKKEIIILAN
ncbi:unnamed protein product [Phaedon cochleariae]|uniref:G-protein coupled receptors family 2 profile 2 domain-containing protein n=1 Tax=Phaedon cochleariae TaxID=80249 RepID=A0A9N9X3U5_PHACE|nr:unnamed protein product [Phaedon cochleariae]